MSCESIMMLVPVHKTGAQWMNDMNIHYGSILLSMLSHSMGVSINGGSQGFPNRKPPGFQEKAAASLGTALCADLARALEADTCEAIEVRS